MTCPKIIIKKNGVLIIKEVQFGQGIKFKEFIIIYNLSKCRILLFIDI